MDAVNVEQVTELLERAGRLVGWMDFRIAKRGQFGAFIAELVAGPGLEKANGAAGATEARPAKAKGTRVTVGGDRQTVLNHV